MLNLFVDLYTSKMCVGVQYHSLTVETYKTCVKTQLSHLLNCSNFQLKVLFWPGYTCIHFISHRFSYLYEEITTTLH